MSVSISTSETLAESPKPSLHWYYSVEGKSHGPVNEQDVFRLAREGTVITDTLIWHPGREDWEPVWKLMPQAIEHLNKRNLAEPAKGETERIPLSEQEQMARVNETMFKRFFARLKRS